MTVRNHCEDEKDKDKDVYECIQSVDTRRKQKKQAGRVKEEENENNYDVSAELLVIVDDNGPQENDENDYVNVTQPFGEQTG